VDQTLTDFFSEPQLFLPVLAFSVFLLGAGSFLTYRTALAFVHRVRSLRWLMGTVSGCRTSKTPLRKQGSTNQDTESVMKSSGAGSVP